MIARWPLFTGGSCRDRSGNTLPGIVAVRRRVTPKARRAMISAAIVSGRITFEFEGSEGEEAGRRRGERWDQDHSVDRLMGCNTVAITGPSLLLSPFFPLHFFPSIYLSPFLPLFPRFLYQLYPLCFNFFVRFLFFLSIEGIISNRKPILSCNGKRRIRVDDFVFPLPPRCPFIGDFLAACTHGPYVCQRHVRTRSVSTCWGVTDTLRLRYLLSTRLRDFPPGKLARCHLRLCAPPIHPAEVKPFHPRFFPARESACHLGGARFHLYSKGGGCRNGTQ